MPSGPLLPDFRIGTSASRACPLRCRQYRSGATAPENPRRHLSKTRQNGTGDGCFCWLLSRNFTGIGEVGCCIAKFAPFDNPDSSDEGRILISAQAPDVRRHPATTCGPAVLKSAGWRLYPPSAPRLACAPARWPAPTTESVFACVLPRVSGSPPDASGWTLARSRRHSRDQRVISSCRSRTLRGRICTASRGSGSDSSPGQA